MLYARKDWSMLRRLVFGNAVGGGGGSLTEYEVEGNPAVFNTNVKKNLTGMVVPFTPIQDLHGQSSPYPAGGGANIWNEEMVIGTISNTSSSLGADNDADDNLRTNYIDVSGFSELYIHHPKNSNGIYRIYEYDENKTIPCLRYVDANNLGVFTVPSDCKYIRFRTYATYGTTYKNDISVNSPSTVTSYAPYSNICPISGITGMNVSASGANLLNPIRGNLITFGTSCTLSDGEITSGSGTTWAGFIFPLQEGIHYYVGYNRTSGGTTYTRIATYSDVPSAYADESRVREPSNKSGAGTTDDGVRYTDFTAQANEKYVWIGVYKSSGSKVFTVDDFYVRIDGKQEYTPYVGETYPIMFPLQGKNKFNHVGELNGLYVDSNGELSNSVSWAASSYIPVEPNTEYTFNPNSEGGSTSRHAFYDEDFTFISAISSGEQTFTTPSKASYMRFSYRIISNNIQLEQGSSATAYEAPTMYYGGELDVLTGELMVDKALIDLGSMSWTYYTGATNPLFYGDISAGAGTTTIGENVDILCSAYKANSSAMTADNFSALGDKQIGVNVRDKSTVLRILVSDYDYNTAASFKTAVSGVQLVYPLKTPVEYQLTPQQIQTLIGDNVIFSDTNGENTIKYLKKG